MSRAARPATKVIRKCVQLEEQIIQLKRNMLRESGWKESSDYPGACWLWSKTFPESNVQSRWQGSNQVAREGFIANGVTLDMAVTIEAAWQELYWRGELP